MNLSVVSRNIGIVLLFDAFFMFLSAVVSMLYGFDSSFSPLILSSFITFIAGSFPLVFVRRKDSINTKEGFTIVVFSWVLSCIFGMLPYVLWGGEYSLVNAWFESVSGYTTCGATAILNVEALPKGLLFWRSATHFLGGLGVVVFMLLVLPAVSGFMRRLSKVEISALSKQDYKFKTKQTIVVMASVYLGLNIAEIICLLLAGMDLFDAVNHAFSTVATGGFSTRNLSIKAYDSVGIELIITIFMFLSSLHFGLIYLSVVSRSFKLFKSPITRYYLFFTIACTLVVAFNLRLSGTMETWGESLRHSLFQVVSLASTTGFATADTSVWPNISVLILTLVSIQCACSGSTSGGIKVDRFFIFFKSIKAQLKKYVHPNAVIPVRVGNHIVEPQTITTVLLYMVFYALIVFVSIVLLSMMGVGFTESISSSIASMANVGPGFGSVGSLGNYALFPAMGKVVLTMLMLLGRLEIFPFIIIFVIYRWR